MRDEVREAALKLLDYQDRSAGELKERLIRKSFSEWEADEAVKALQECGLVDDRRYASVFARSKFEAGKGRVYVANHLSRKKISAEIIEEVMEELLEEKDESILCLKKALSVCGLSDRFEVGDGGEIERKPGFSVAGEEEPAECFEPANEAIRSDRQARRIYREKAKAKAVRRLISAGFSPGIAFEAVRRIADL